MSRASFLGVVLALCLSASIGSAHAQDDAISANLVQTILRGAESKVPLSSVGGHVWFGTREVIDRASPFFGAKLCAVTIPLQNARMRANYLAQQDSKFALFQKTASIRDAVLVNGGFWDMTGKGEHRPMGLVISNRATKSRAIPWTSGGAIMSWGTGNISFQKLVVPFRGTDAVDAVQSKPFVVEDGKNGIRRNNEHDRFDRTAVGINDNGELVIAGIFAIDGKAASLWQFGEILRTSQSKGGLGVKKALAMNGGPGAFIFIPSTKEFCGSAVVNFVPDILAFSGER